MCSNLLHLLQQYLSSRRFIRRCKCFCTNLLGLTEKARWLTLILFFINSYISNSIDQPPHLNTRRMICYPLSHSVFSTILWYKLLDRAVYAEGSTYIHVSDIHWIHALYCATIITRLRTHLMCCGVQSVSLLYELHLQPSCFNQSLNLSICQQKKILSIYFNFCWESTV